eukprot:SAG22_NODE_206_length_15281_cov_6.078975_8_plen_230_part_00
MSKALSVFPRAPTGKFCLRRCLSFPCRLFACLSPRGTGAAVRVFPTEAELEAFIGGAGYENPEGSGAGKVAFAIVFGQMDRAAADWSYTIRANYTSPVFGQQRQPTVACLYPGSQRRPCPFQWTVSSKHRLCAVLPVFRSKTAPFRAVPQQQVPSTREPATRRFRQLPSRSRLYGYTFGGYSTLQLAVDTYILFGDRAGAVSFEPSYSLMPVRPYVADNFFDVVDRLFG